MEWLFHCNTHTLWKIELHLPCSVLVWDNYVILKVYSWNITSKATLVYIEIINLEVTLKLSFQGPPPFLAETSWQDVTKFSTESCFTHPSLIFAAQGLITSLEHTKFCVSFLAQSPWKLGIFSFHEKLSVNSE